MKYNAFISYRHLPKDKFVAETLHRTLESFKLPKSLYSKCKIHNIERVFRDKDELPLSSDLSEPIDAALKESEFLIVVCTPQLRESRWCLREIDTFKELHGREKIFAVLAEGEPSESFPEALLSEEYEETDENGNVVKKTRFVEPLAADVRGKNNRKIKKLIKEETIRLVAPMFGLSYDDLKQRHRERIIKRRIAYSSVIAGVIAIFGIVSSTMAVKIYRQNVVIKKNYAQSLSAECETLFAEGDLNRARSKAEEAVENAETEKSLHALSMVKGENVAYGCHALTDCYECESGVTGMLVSPDNNYIVVEDGIQQVSVYNISKAEWTKIPGDAIILDNGYAGFITDSLFAYNTSEGLVTYEITNKSRNVVSDRFSKVISAPDKKSFSAISLDSIKIYDAESLECIKDTMVPVNSDCSAAYSEDGRYFAVAMMGENTLKGTIYVLDTESGNIVAKNEYEGGAPVSITIKDGSYAVSLCNMETEGATTKNIICAYDFDGKLLWKSDEEKTVFSYVDYCNNGNDAIFTYQFGMISLFDANNGQLLNDVLVAGSVAGCEKSGNGKYIITTLEGDVLEYDVTLFITNALVNYDLHPSLKTQQAFIRDGILYIHFNGADYISVYTKSEKEEARTLSDNAEEYIEANPNLAWFQTAMGKMYTRDSSDKIPKDEETSIILFSPNHSLMACNKNGSYRIYKNGDEKPLYSLKLNAGMLNYVFFSEDESWFVANYKNGTLELYDALTGSEIVTLEKEYPYVFDVVNRPELNTVIVDAAYETRVLDNDFNVRTTYPKTADVSAVGYNLEEDELILRTKNTLNTIKIH